VKITVTIGWNEWCVNEGQVSKEEGVTLDWEDAQELGLAK